MTPKEIICQEFSRVAEMPDANVVAIINYVTVELAPGGEMLAELTRDQVREFRQIVRRRLAEWMVVLDGDADGCGSFR